MIRPLVRSLEGMVYRLFPDLFWKPFADKSRTLGLDQLYLIISFDCDTDEDIVAAEIIHNWLRHREQAGVFAVPGEQLLQGAKTYQKMARDGAEFINHGGASHTYWGDGRYQSRTFYNQMSTWEVEDDIRRGHQIFQSVLGQNPQGFRAPHFGHYETKPDLAHLYGVMRSLDYRYSSTTTPRLLTKLGPMCSVDGLLEFPTTGTYYRPTKIFDSWGKLESRKPSDLRPDYFHLFRQTIEVLKRKGIPGILNYYVDPAHVTSTPYYFDAITFALSQGVPIRTFSFFLNLNLGAEEALNL